MTEELPGPKAVNDEKTELWNRILRAALSMPGARIDRASFLRRELSKRYTEEIVTKAIASRPAEAGISPEEIQKIAKSCIAWHRNGVSAVSFATGIPGLPWVPATIPADMTQFFWHVIVILQKLAYLYGWPSFGQTDDELDDETLSLFTLFVAVMFGAGNAAKGLGVIADKFAGQIAKRLPKQALGKVGLYRIAKEAAKWIGIRLTKETFAKGIGRIVPVMSGFICGGISWASFTVMSKRLREHLEELQFAKKMSA